METFKVTIMFARLWHFRANRTPFYKQLSLYKQRNFNEYKDKYKYK